MRLVIKLVVYDGTDRFGRYVMKAHNLILDTGEYRNLYLNRGLPYYITPLLDGHVTNEADNMLEEYHFREPDISRIKPYDLLYNLLCFKKVSVYMDIYQSDVVMMLLSVLDYALPPEVNNQVSILSYIPQSMVDHLEANIAFYHASQSVKNRTYKTSSAFLKNYLDNLTGPYNRHRYQTDLMLGNINDAHLITRFRKAYNVSKEGKLRQE